MSGNAEWVSRFLGRPLTDFQADCVDILCLTKRCGPYDFAKSWARAEFASDYVYVNIPDNGGFATWDSDGLTQLVIAAHEKCIRVELSWSNPQHLRVMLSKRQREGGIAERHPTIEDAVARYRMYHAKEERNV